MEISEYVFQKRHRKIAHGRTFSPKIVLAKKVSYPHKAHNN